MTINDILVYFVSQHEIWAVWFLLLCFPSAFLEPNGFPQKSHGIDIPSKWLTSIWFLMCETLSSFPHTLQMKALFCLGVPPDCFPSGIMLLLFSIIELIFTSNASKSQLNWFVIINSVVASATVWTFGTISSLTKLWAIGFINTFWVLLTSFWLDWSSCPLIT